MLVGHGMPELSFGIWIPWPVLTLGFAVADIFTVHIEFKQEAHSFSLNELPLVLGLVFSSPVQFVLARMVGGFLAVLIVRRQSGVKLLFNSALFALEATAAVAMYASFLRMGHSDVARWFATFAATLGVNLLASAAVTTVISLSKGERDGEGFRRTLLAGAVTTGGTTALALVAVELVRFNAASIGLVLVVAAIMFAGYRGYAALHQRYANLQRLYEFTGSLARSSGLETAVRSSLARAAELMRAESAAISLIDATGGIVVTSDGGTLNPAAIVPEDSDWVWSCVVDEGRPVVLSHTSRDRKTRDYLAAREYKDMMMTPLVYRGQIIGALSVHDRLSDVSSFDDEDRKMFETLVVRR